jgi:thymidine phosphorylase
VVWHARPGDQVTEGQPLLTLHTDDEARLARALESLEGGYDVTDGAGFEPRPLLIDRVTG